MKKRSLFPIGNLTINLIEGDIAKVKADALVTAVNSDGMWYGGIDGVIQRMAGSMFHSQVRKALPLVHTQTVVAKKTGTHSGQFGDVVFVIDDLSGPLRTVISSALSAADKAGYMSVSLPALRTGVMLGAVEKNVTEAVREISIGIETFVDTMPPRNLKEITFVVYHAPEVFDALALMQP